MNEPADACAGNVECLGDTSFPFPVPVLQSGRCGVSVCAEVGVEAAAHHLDVREEADMLKNVARMLEAMARPISVLPVPAPPARLP